MSFNDVARRKLVRNMKVIVSGSRMKIVDYREDVSGRWKRLLKLKVVGEKRL